MSRSVDAISIRLLGALAFVGGLVSLAAGTANALQPGHLRDVRFLIPIGLYFMTVSIGTVLLKRFAAIMLALPLAVLGLASILAAIRSGSVGAIVMNLLFSGAIMCAPAVVVYRNWRNFS